MADINKVHQVDKYISDNCATKMQEVEVGNGVLLLVNGVPVMLIYPEKGKPTSVNFIVEKDVERHATMPYRHFSLTVVSE